MNGWMVALVMLGVVVAFDVLALRFGSDSRDGITSDEWERRARWLGWPDDRRALNGGDRSRDATRRSIVNGLLAEDLARERWDQVERDLAHAQLLREARAARAARHAHDASHRVRGRSSAWAAAAARLRSGAAAAVGLAGGGLIGAGRWLQALGAVPADGGAYTKPLHERYGGARPIG